MFSNSASGPWRSRAVQAEAAALEAQQTADELAETGEALEQQAEELAAHCASRLAKYKVPAEFRFVPALPTNASGKILKRELREWS